MRLAAAALAAALMVGAVMPAQAGAVATCLADADKSPNGAPETCIGVASGPCLEKPDNLSTSAQVDCLYAEQAEWDVFLNQTYQKLLKAAPKKAVEKIRKSQRAWVAAREADCGLYHDLVEGGSIYRQLGADCAATMTARRTLQLRGWLDLVAP